MDYGTGVAAVRLNEINSRISTRLAEISSSTGVSFSDVFAGAVSSAGESSSSDSSSLQAAQLAALTGSSGTDANQLALLSSMMTGMGLSSLAGDTDALQSSSLLDSVKQMISSYALQQSLKGLESTLAGQQSGASQTGAVSGYDDIISSLSAQYGMNADLVKAVAKAESGFDAMATSESGAIGVMQLMPATVESLGITNPYDPRQNIEGGIRTLLGHIMRYDGDIKMALAAYNCGAGTLSSRKITDLSDPAQLEALPSETRAFITRVAAYAAEYGSPGILDKNFFG